MRLAYVDYLGRARTHTLLEGQKVVLGSSRGADICLESKHQVDANHCELAIKDGKCRVNNLSKNTQSVMVNGQAVNQLELTRDTELQIGTARLSILFSSGGSAQVAHGPTDDTDGDSRSGMQASKSGEQDFDGASPEPQIMENQVAIFRIKKEAFPARLQETPFGGRNCYLLLNTRLVGLQPEELELENLLGSAVQPYVPEHSLSFVGPAHYSNFELKYQQLLSRGAGVVLYPKDPGLEWEDFLDQWGLFLGWCLQPDALSANLLGGSDPFVERFFEPLTAVLLYLASSGDWQILSRDPAARSFDGLAACLLSAAS